MIAILVAASFGLLAGFVSGSLSAKRQWPTFLAFVALVLGTILAEGLRDGSTANRGAPYFALATVVTTVATERVLTSRVRSRTAIPQSDQG